MTTSAAARPYTTPRGTTVALACVLSGMEALLNPMPVRTPTH